MSDNAFRRLVMAQMNKLMEASGSGDAFDLPSMINAIVDARGAAEPRPMSDAARGLSSNAVEGVLVVEEQMRRQSELHNIETGRLRGHVMELRNERDAAQAELDAIAIALEWPRQDESTTLLEEVKEAACNGVLLAEAKSELHQLKVDLKAARAEVERLRAVIEDIKARGLIAIDELPDDERKEVGA